MKPKHAYSPRWHFPGDGPVVITGGAGFIGTNLAHRVAEAGFRVTVVDNLSRPGVEQNLRWLAERHGERIEHHLADVRDPQAVQRSIAHAGCVFHFAAQVAVTTSLADPVGDFSVNALGTLNVLEACRRRKNPPPLLFTSTNKVYGTLDDVELVADDAQYQPRDPALRHRGVAESRPLDFRSPYGCSKGTADQYVLDYARSYGLPAVVLRMSCIYGPHQCGNEDQGWVAHFVRQTIEGKPITFCGDGRQVRDLLYVDDLVQAMLAAIEHIDATRGRAFNIGGGPSNVRSLIQLVEDIARLHDANPVVRYADWRVGDQRYYVSDTRNFQAATGWFPRIAVQHGVRLLYQWNAQANARRNGVASRAATRVD
jgi:CDP-paratose 2-epimerase